VILNVHILDIASQSYVSPKKYCDYARTFNYLYDAVLRKLIHIMHNAYTLMNKIK